MTGGDVIVKFKADKSSLEKGTQDIEKNVQATANSIKNIVGGIGISAIVGKAMSSISSSIDGAVKRVDTLNNFPKIMELFGVSADEASASIKRIDKSVQGLPTPLNQAVAGVQDLFTVTQNLKESEKLFKSVNDAAMVFASGSTDAVDRFIYAYKQSLSMGKVQAEEFNQMNEAIPGLMTKLAESMGVSYGELKNGLSDGSISIDQFNETLKKLDTEGTSSMKSLGDSAKEATGGIGTSFTNMQTAITRGVGNVIKSINEALTKSGLPDIQGIIGNLTNVINNFFSFVTNSIGSVDLSGMANALSNLFNALSQVDFSPIISALGEIAKLVIQIGLPALINTVASAIPVIQQLAPAILPVVAGIVAYKGAIAGIKTVSTIFGGVSKIVGFGKAFLGLIPAIKSVKGAMMLLNIAFGANPIALIIAAIVGLIAGFALLWTKCEGFRNFWINLWNSIINVVMTVFNFLKGIVDKVVGFITNNWQSLLLMIVNPFAGVFSLIYNHCEGFRTFIDNLIIGIKTTINNIITFIASIPSKIWQFLTDMVNKLATAINNMRSKATSGIRNVFNAIVNGLKNLPSNMLNVGRNLVVGLWNGISNKVGWIVGKVKGFGNAVIKSIKGIFGVHSPSRVFAWVGEMNMQGLYNGMEDMQPKVQSMINGMFNLSPSVYGTATNNVSPNVNVVNNISMEQDQLGNWVKKVKTFSGGSKNDYNYGMGA